MIPLHQTYPEICIRIGVSRDRIARYRGGFEIHCPRDARVQISLSALSAPAIVTNILTHKT